MRKSLEVTDSDAAYLASWLGKFLLFTPQKGTSTSCPGLTGEDYAFLNLQGKEELWNPAAGGLNLLRTKILAAKLLASGLFDDRERFLPAVIASADSASPISDVGEDMLKRAMPATDLEDENLVYHLFKMYFGEGEAPRVKAPLRLKILGLLNKSVRSTTFANKIMRIVDDGISPPSMDGEDTVMSNSSTSNAGIGREAAKSRTAIFQYINFVARYGSTETLHAIATRVVTRLRDFIENQGWPRPGPNEDLVSRGYTYEVIGILSKAGPRSTLVEDEHPSLDLLRWLFESQARDSSGSSIVVSIEEALSTVLSAMARIEFTTDEQGVLEGLLIDQMSKSAELQENKRLRSTRFVAVRFANRCLPYASVRARWIDVLGIGAHGDRAEVREEAERGLSPYWHRMLNGSLNASQPDNIAFPSFDATVSQFFSGRTSDDRLEPFALARQTSKDYRHCFQHMTGFVRRLIFHEAMTANGIATNVDSEWERRIDAGAESDEHTRNAIKKHLKVLASDLSRPLQVLLNALFVGLVENVSGAGNQLADFIALAPNALLEPLVLNVADILPVLQSNDHARRTAGAHVYGVLASHPSAQDQAISTQLKQISAALSKWQSGVGAALNQAHGAIVGLGFYFSRASYRGQSFQTSAEFQQLRQTILSIITESREASLKEASYMALGQLCMFNAIQATALGESRELRNAIDRVYETAKTGDEAAILCLGQMSMVLGEESSEDSDLRYLEEQLYKLHEIRQAEVHFSVGEALSYVASGWRSEALATKLDIEGPLPDGPGRNDSLTRVVDRVLADSGMTKPALRKAATMWLLCLVQFCGQQPEIQQRLPKFQTAFKRCLGDRDELVQETASRGLGLVYEKGDRRLKDDLVRDLVSSFSSDKQSQLAGNVSAETQLFEPGALPTGDGSVSTYKDIMSLASEVGDSSLVYKFMSMASSNAIWSSRAA
ncbi:ARM repeat-containing protein, partial [Hortaea werneckii]